MPRLTIKKDFNNQLDEANRKSLNQNFSDIEKTFNNLDEDVTKLKDANKTNINGHQYANLNERMNVLEHIIQDELGYDLPGKEVII